MLKHIYILFISLCLLSACDIDSDPLPKSGDDRNKFVGTWTCTDFSTVFGTSSFTVEISRIGTNDSIELKNWYNLGMNTEAIALVADNSVVIPNQIITGFQITGTGFYNEGDDEIAITFTADDGSIQDQVLSTLKK